MAPRHIHEDIFWIGVNDTQTKLFEGLWLIEKEGISYNSYLIKDKKNVLIDLCKEMQSTELLENIRKIINPAEIDYLVVNHMEPDHSGALAALLEAAPQITILGSSKAGAMLEGYFGSQERFRSVQDNETLDLGDHQLRFLSTPMVHWPETMMTYEESSGILFSCDGFGGYGRLEEGIFDSDYSDVAHFEKEALRYFANIVCAFSKPVLNAAEKLAGLNIKMVAPSHGLVWKKDPQRILDLYVRWSQYAKGSAEKGITLLYGSMYGNTQAMMEAVFTGVESSGVAVQRFDVTQTHISNILPALWTQAGVLIGAPTYEGSLFPTMQSVLEMARTKRIFHKKAAYFGSYSWGGGATRFLNNIFQELEWELTETLEFLGKPRKEDLLKGKGFGKRFGELIAKST